MTKDGELFSVSIRDAEFLQQIAKKSAQWFNNIRKILQEYNPTDRYTIPITGDLFER